MSNQFIPIDRDTLFVIPVQDWLPEEHLARFIVEIVESLDVTSLEAAYGGGGSAPYPPKMMLALLFYGYATGIFSSRALERATYELIPVMYITGNTHPDHNSINTFRKRFLGELKGLFVQILLRAYALGVLQLGTLSLDGSKVHANASKHKAMSWDYANRLEEQLQAEVEALLQQAEAGNTEPLPGLKVADEVALRQARLQQISEVKVELEARAQARYEQEQAAYEAQLAQRRAKEQARGRKLGGRPPNPPEPGPQGKDQVNFTDPESRIMPVSGGGFEQASKALISVDHGSRLVIENPVSQQPNDQQELQPVLDRRQLPEDLGQVDHLRGDNGYGSAANVTACEAASITPLLAMGRAAHPLTSADRFADPGKAPDPSAAVARLKHRLPTPAGQTL